MAQKIMVRTEKELILLNHALDLVESAMYKGSSNSMDNVVKSINNTIIKDYIRNMLYAGGNVVTDSSTLLAKIKNTRSWIKSLTICELTVNEPLSQSCVDRIYDRIQIVVKENFILKVISDSSTGIGAKLTVHGEYLNLTLKPRIEDFVKGMDLK
jgi:hypothetical protein